MFSRRWLQKLHSLGLEFWLPLPLLGIGFWVGGKLVTDQLLSQPYTTADKLQADSPMGVQFSITAQVITAEIHKSQGITRVAVRNADSTPANLEFELSHTEFSQVEAMIAQKLRISVEDVRQLVRYQVKN